MARFHYIAVLFITAAALVIFSVTLVRALYVSPANEIDAAPNAQPTQNIPPEEQPARLEIPKLGVDAHVQHVGIAASGNMAVPTNFTDVGWYRHGTVPGQRGSAVIDGHVDNGLALPGVFKRLGELEVGDDVYVVTKEGRRLHFVVQEVRSYGYQEVPRERLFNRSDAPRLNLITCEGDWIRNERTYDGRLVVYTVLVD